MSQIKTTVTNTIKTIQNSTIYNTTKQATNTFFSYITLITNKLNLNLKIFLIIFLIILIYFIYVNFIEKVAVLKDETYYVNGKYTYKNANQVCQALGSKLATLKQLYNNYKLGADWCKYGWLKSKIVAYPNQIKTNYCGDSGINGNYQNDETKKYGAVCIGEKRGVDIKNLDKNQFDEKDIEKLKLEDFAQGYYSYNDLLSNQKND
jgi:hypothetical protein